MKDINISKKTGESATSGGSVFLLPYSPNVPFFGDSFCMCFSVFLFRHFSPYAANGWAQMQKGVWDTKTKTRCKALTASAGKDNFLVHLYQYLHVQDKRRFG